MFGLHKIIKHTKDYSKRRLIVYLFTLLIGSISLFILLYFPAKLERQAIETSINKAKSITEITAFSIAPSVYFNDKKTLFEALSSTKQVNTLSGVFVYNTDEELISAIHHEAGIMAPEIESDEQYGFSSDGYYLFVYKVINFEGLEIGVIKVVFSLSEVRKDVQEARISVLILSAVIFLVGSISVFFITRLISKPLKHLTRTFETISAGDYKKRAEIETSDEFGVLSKSFNAMVDKLEKAYTQLSNVNKNLEDRVIERTESLKSEVEYRRSAEEKLKQTNQILSSITNASPLPIMSFNIQGLVLWASPAVYEVFGYKEKDILGIFNPLVPEDKKNLFLLGLQEQFSMKEKMQYMMNCKKKDGNIVNIQVTSAPIIDDTNKTIGIMAILEDISNRIKAEQALRESEEKYRALFDNSLLGIGILKNEQFVFANNTLLKMWGYNELEGFVNQNLFDLIPPEDVERFREKIFENEIINSIKIEQDLVLNNGKHRVYEISISEIIIEKEYYYQLVFLDITERKEAEKKIKQINIELEKKVFERTALLNDALNDLRMEITERQRVEEKLRFSDIILQKVSTLVLVADENADIIYVSPFAKTLLGYEPEELMGPNWFLLTRTTVDEIEAERDYIRKAANGEVNVSELPYERRIRAKNGDYKWIQWQDAKGEGKTIIGVGTDFSDKVLAAEKLKQASLELSKALEKEIELGELKTRFVSMISHEYRTPLTVILSSTSIIEKYIQRNEIDQVNAFLNKIKSSVQTMVRLLEDVLVLGKSETGKMLAEKFEFDLGSVLNEVVDDLKAAYRKTQEINVNIVGNIDSVNSDLKLIRQILTNLISNAIKFSPEEKPIEIKVISEVDMLTISIADKGIGIPKEDQKYLFEDFHRGKNTVNISGTGLGMAIVKRCVDALAGKIEVHSEVNQGTVFIVNFPK